MADKPKLATMQDPLIAAAMQQLLRLESKTKAAEKLQWIGKQYIRAKEQDTPQNPKQPTLRLWVRGFAVTKEEKKQGYVGQYAKLSVAAIEGGRFTIKAEKLLVDLAKHPQKNPPKMQHPNGAHPLMRAAETGRVFTSITALREKLMRFHEEFSEASLPGKDRLHVKMYNRKQLEEGGESPIQKITLKIEAVADGGFKLIIKKPSAKKPQTKDQAQTEEQGKFATMVKQARPRKPLTDSKKDKKNPTRR